MSDVKQSMAGWFEIPVTNMERAMTFYETVLEQKLERHQMGPLDMAWFPYTTDQNASGAGGSLVHNEEFYQPSDKGTLVYLNAPSGDLTNELSRVVAAGGKVVVPKTAISEDHGFMGVFIDTEGNRVAFHSMQ